MSFVDEIMKIPPVTRFLCGSLLGVSLPMMLRIVSPYRFLFVRELVTHKYEVSIGDSDMFRRLTREHRSGECSRASSSEVWLLDV